LKTTGMQPHGNSSDEHDELPPAGRRWGRGAGSVLPYLTKSLQAKPLENPEARGNGAKARNPVFPDWPRNRPG
jgi:hypothetical protein